MLRQKQTATRAGSYCTNWPGWWACSSFIFSSFPPLSFFPPHHHFNPEQPSPFPSFRLTTCPPPAPSSNCRALCRKKKTRGGGITLCGFLLCRRKTSNCLGFSSQCPSRDKCHCLFFYLDVLLPPPPHPHLSPPECAWKWQLMSQFIHHRLLVIITPGTEALFRCDGVFIYFFSGGGRGYLLFKRARHSHGTTQTLPLRRMAAGSPVEEPSHPASLSFFFLFFFCFPTIAPTLPPSTLPISHLHSIHSICLV